MSKERVEEAASQCTLAVLSHFRRVSSERVGILVYSCLHYVFIYFYKYVCISTQCAVDFFSE